MRPHPLLLGLTGLGTILSLAGCASISPGACPTGQSEGRQAELFFGRNIGDQLGVSDEAFARFIDEELTPRFPNGLTILDARGQWRSAAGPIVREPSKIVILALPGRSGGEDRLQAARQAYRQRFDQEAVLITTRPACLGF